MVHKAGDGRYPAMKYNRVGKSGLLLPAVSLGLWHNFGTGDSPANMKAMLFRAFDLGITHFDLANNYGPLPGSAEKNFGAILKRDLASYRDELIISTKAGYRMWPGPYGEWGSKKYLTASLDQSLKRMKLDYVDIFYSHRFDPETPLEETMEALVQAVRRGKALYAGISNYGPEDTLKAARILRAENIHLLIHQASYSMFNRWVENGLLEALEKEGSGCIAFSPLAQGMLTDRYAAGIPKDSRAGKPGTFLKPENVTEEKLAKVAKLRAIAEKRGQKLSQMALAWVLRHSVIASVLVGASKPSQIEENAAVITSPPFTPGELTGIDSILK